MIDGLVSTVSSSIGFVLFGAIISVLPVAHLILFFLRLLNSSSICLPLHLLFDIPLSRLEPREGCDVLGPYG